MTETSGVEFSIRLLRLLHGLKEPITLSDLIKTELTGDIQIDDYLTTTFTQMLRMMKDRGILNSGELSKIDAFIYGLTSHGDQVYEAFSHYKRSK